jgi:SPX domain protein involved in polyphosphate accumulation
MRYKSLYFDTEKFDLYRLHQNGKLNRYKVRIREYVETDVKFLETKFKTNKGRTVKTRREKSGDFDLEDIDYDFIDKHTQVPTRLLKPCLWVFYSRITLVNNSMTERVTLDLNLEFDNNTNKVGYKNIVIAEVKRDKLANDSMFSELLREAKIQNSGLSKYCIGLVSVYDNVKYNKMKPKILKLKKISRKYVS